MMVYGRNAVREALRGPRVVRAVWATERAAQEPSRGASGEPWRGEAGQVEVELAGGARLEELCGSADHQGVCAEVEPYTYARAEDLLEAPEALVLCLDEVQDPRNLGAVCRVAECAGASGVVIPERRSAEVTAVVCKTSAGAVEHLPVARVRNVADYLELAKRSGAWVYGAAPAGGVPYDAPDYSESVVLVLGAEGRGLRPRVARACDQLVALPLLGRVDSLNVSSAAAVLLYEILQARGREVDIAP